MWLFTKSGHVSIGQYPFDHELLVVHAQLREEMDSFVVLLDDVAGEKHEVREQVEENYHYEVRAKRAVVAEAVTRMVTAIDNSRHTHGYSASFGSSTGFFLWINPTGLHVAVPRE
mgnify:CR=1 FL=1